MASITVDRTKALALINSVTAQREAKIIGCLVLAGLLAHEQAGEESQFGFVTSLGTIHALMKHLGSELNVIQDAAFDEEG